MKHASARTLASVQPLLQQLRALPGLVERTPGAFYLRSKAFLHFHEDPTGVFADVKLNPQSFERRRVSLPIEQAALMTLIRNALKVTAT